MSLAASCVLCLVCLVPLLASRRETVDQRRRRRLGLER